MEKRQVVVIGGGEAFDTREEYLAYLRDVPYDPYEVRPDGWKKNLPIVLGDGYEVIAPSMPCPVNAKYDEWEIWFDRVVPFLRDGVVFVGHSLGANFLVKYLVGNTLLVKTGGLHLVAGCFGYVGGFNLLEPIGSVSERPGKIFIYHSHDDPLVPFADAEKYHAALPGSELLMFDDREHFLQESFPELVDRIRA
jgi:predicted alpha/beta hydrolase family esterase